MTKKEEYEIKGWNDDKIIKLLPCAFCGAEPELLHIGNDYKPKKRITIKCKKCRVERTDAALRYDFDWLENVAQKNWNDRSLIENEIREKSDKLLIAKNMCKSIISYYETDRIYVTDPFIDCVGLAKKTLAELEKEKE